MTKSELIERLAENGALTKGRAEQVVNTIFDCMSDALKQGEGIEIRGFGSFTVRQYKAYEGRNPRTGEGVRVAPKRLPFFKVGKDLRERINGAEASVKPVAPESGGGDLKPTRKSGGKRRGGGSPAQLQNRPRLASAVGG